MNNIKTIKGKDKCTIKGKDKCTTCRAPVCNYAKDECVCVKCVEYKIKLINAGEYDGESLKKLKL